MRYAGLLVLALAASCVGAAADEEASETEQAMWDGSGEADGETIRVQGGLDSCWAGLCWPSSWSIDPGPGYSGDFPGGAGGHGIGGPKPDGGPGPQPARKECFPTFPDEICLDCCLYNYNHVDGWKCRKYKNGSKGWRNCWAEASEKLADCQVNACDRHGPQPIPTIEDSP